MKFVLTSGGPTEVPDDPRIQELLDAWDQVEQRPAMIVHPALLPACRELEKDWAINKLWEEVQKMGEGGSGGSTNQTQGRKS